MIYFVCVCVSDLLGFFFFWVTKLSMTLFWESVCFWSPWRAWPEQSGAAVSWCWSGMLFLTLFKGTFTQWRTSPMWEHHEVENHLCASAVVRGVVTTVKVPWRLFSIKTWSSPWRFPVLLLGNEQHVAQTGLLGAECLGEGHRSFEWHKMI